MAVKEKQRASSVRTPRKKVHTMEYDAAKTSTRRRAPSSKVQAEHVVLPVSSRRRLVATAQDQVRNSSLCAWMIRRHLDYTSKYRFQFRTGSESLDRVVNRLFDWHASPRNFDIGERLGREEMFRLFELEKVTAGDAALVKLANGKMQAVESDLIAYPKSGRWDAKSGGYSPIPSEVMNSVDKSTGVVMDESIPGRVDKFCICNRGRDGRQTSFDHLEDSSNVIFDAYYNRLSSQVRGVTPLASAINAIQDLYEGIDYALAKAKIHSLFGLALMRDYATVSSDQDELNSWGGNSGVANGADANADATTADDSGIKHIAAQMQEIKPSDMIMLDMDLRGRVETIESKTPSTEFQNFTDLIVRFVLLSLDIPYSAFNTQGASFSSLIADQNLYEIACSAKREKNKWKRYEYSDWLLEMVWNDDSEWPIRILSEKAGIWRLRDLQAQVEWVPSGTPWLQKLQEVQGDIKAISIGLDNPMDACKRRGTDFYENIRKTSEAYAYAQAMNVPLMIGDPGQSAVESVLVSADKSEAQLDQIEEETDQIQRESEAGAEEESI